MPRRARQSSGGPLRTLRALGVLVVAVAALSAGPTPVRAAEPLPTDPAVVTGVLDNGLAYVIRKHGNPAGRVSIWLHVASGSLNETEETRGLAHYLEHMAFNGSANFPPGSLIPFFQSLGLSFGRDQNAFTGFEQTTYTLTLPDTRPETLDKAFLYLSDVAMRLSLAPVEVDNERQIILEEKRFRAGPQQRVQDSVFERLAPEATIGRRLPIGAEETIRAVTPEALRDYYTRWYVASHMTLIVVGDVEPAPIIDLTKRHFGGAPKVPRPPDRDVGVKTPTTMRAIVATDPELTQDEVSVARVEPPRPPTTTVEELRRDLVELLGTRAFNRRLAAQIAQGKVSFVEAHASVRQYARAIRLVTAEASGKPGTWRTMLAELGTELQRARLHGFSEREIQDARTAHLAEGEEAVQQEPTLPARSLLYRINGVVARHEPVTSAAQRLALLQRLLPGITAREVTDAFAASFEPATATFIAELRAGADVPSEADLLAPGRAALDVKPDPWTEAAPAAALLDRLPASGKIVESAEHAASGVFSAWLDNGVRLHHRFMDQERNQVTVAVTLAGGRIQETASNRGITDAAVVAWERAATGTLGSSQIRDLMTGKKVRVRGEAGPDALTLTVSGSPADLEVGLQLAYLLLTDPVIEPAAFERWKASQAQAIAARKVDPNGVLSEAMAEAFYPKDEPRPRPLEDAQVQRVARDDAQAWLRRLIAEAPIEVAIAGDVDRATATRLAEQYVGALPARPRIDAKTFRDLRTIPRAVGPIAVARTVGTRTPQAFVADGFFGTDIQNVGDARLLAMASRILSTRMNATVRREKQLVYSIGAASRPASEYPGFGLFIAQAPTDPAKVQALAATLEDMYGAFAKDGPTEDELQVARKQFANLLDQTLKERDFWVTRLATLDYRGLSLTDVVEAPAAYQQLTAEGIRDGFRRYWKPEGRFRFVVTPTG